MLHAVMTVERWLDLVPRAQHFTQQERAGRVSVLKMTP
jgi:hypothetical protein